MFKFIKQIFISTIMFFNSLSSVNPLECVSIKNQECKVIPKIIDVSSNDPIFYPFSIRVNKCSGNCNNINDSYAKICTPDIVKNLNVKVFNLMRLTNETRHIKWHETCKQRWNEGKCRCECKELIDEGVCDKGYFFNPSNCDCECDKSCSIGEYLDYSSCKCRKKLIDSLVEECSENIDVIKIDSENDHIKECSSCIVYIVFFSIFFAISIVIGIYFVYSHWHFKKDSVTVDFNTHKETLIY